MEEGPNIHLQGVMMAYHASVLRKRIMKILKAYMEINNMNWHGVV
jgi:hypothetical protein